MDDAAAMGAVEGGGDLDAVARDVGEWQWSFLEAGGEGFALEVLHHQVVEVVLAANIVERADMGVGELGDGAGFALEAGVGLRVRRQVRGQHLDGDVAAKAGVAGPVNLPHPAGAYQADNFVRPQSDAGTKAHGTLCFRTTTRTPQLPRMGRTGGLYTTGGSPRRTRRRGLFRPRQESP